MTPLTPSLVYIYTATETKKIYHSFSVVFTNYLFRIKILTLAPDIPCGGGLVLLLPPVLRVTQGIQHEPHGPTGGDT